VARIYRQPVGQRQLILEAVALTGTCRLSGQRTWRPDGVCTSVSTRPVRLPTAAFGQPLRIGPAGELLDLVRLRRTMAGEPDDGFATVGRPRAMPRV
jgi:hypothetical protein